MATRRVAKKTTPKKRNKAPIKSTLPKEPVTTPPKSSNEATYLLFCEFMALPSVVRSEVFRHPKTQEPLETQKEFAEAYNVRQERLSEWKRDEDYHQRVSKIRRQYFRGEIGDAIQAVLLTVIQHGRGADLKVLLEYTKEIERDDPTGEVGEQLASILKKLNVMIPG